MSILLTERDTDILEVLTHKVRTLSVGQVSRTWWKGAGSTAVAKSRLRMLFRDDLINLESAPAHPEIVLTACIVSWEVDGATPDWNAVSYQLQSRWREHPVLTGCVSATKKAAAQFGGYGGRPSRAVERTHDLHMAQVFLHFRANRPDLACSWISEDQIKYERKVMRPEDRRTHASNARGKLPDAILRLSSGVRAIEFGGAYGKDKLQAFHSYCKEHSFPYEIW